MGMNFYSCCHKCKEKVFHFRGHENETLLPFYRRHYACMSENPANLETLEDQKQEAWWMRERGNGGYSSWKPANKCMEKTKKNMNIEGERPNIADVLNRHNKRTGIIHQLDDLMPILRKHGRRWKREFAIAIPSCPESFWFYQYQYTPHAEKVGRIRSWQADDETFILDEEFLKNTPVPEDVKAKWVASLTRTQPLSVIANLY